MAVSCHKCGFRKMADHITCIRCGERGPASSKKEQPEITA